MIQRLYNCFIQLCSPWW